MYILLVWCSVIAAVLGSHIHGGGLFLDAHGEYAPSYDNYQPHDYQFNYAVSDPHTGDHKSQWEVKEKGVVRGGYSLLEPDGTTRIVEYIADDHGFRAVVKKLGTSIHPSSVEAHGFSGGYAQGATVVQNAVPIATNIEVPVATKVEVPVLSKVEVPFSGKVELPVATKVSVPLAQNVEYSVPSIGGNIGWAPRAEFSAIAKEEVPVISQAAVGQYIEEIPGYSSYNGHVSNYANVLNAAVQHLEPLSYKRPIEIPQSVELHGWQSSIGNTGAWDRIGNTAGWDKTGSYGQQYILPQQSASILNSHNIQSQTAGYNYQIPHPSPVVNEILVPRAPGLSNVVVAKQESVSPCPDVQLGTQQYTLQSIEQPRVVFNEQPKLVQPSVQISSQVHGTTGNLQDDSAYTNYGPQTGGYQQASLGSYGTYQQAGSYQQSPASYGTLSATGSGPLSSASYGIQSSGGYETQPSAGYGAQLSAGSGAQLSASYGSQPSASYGAQPSASYGTQPSPGYGAQLSASYGTQPSSSYGAQPSAGYGSQPSANYNIQPSVSYGAEVPANYAGQSNANYGTSQKVARSYTTSNLLPSQNVKLPYSAVVSHPVLK